MEINWWWLLGMIGPLGLMGIIRASVNSYNDWKASRQPQLTFASRDRVDTLEGTLERIFPEIVGISYHDCIITDESSLEDFMSSEDEVQAALAKLNDRFGVDASTLSDFRLVTIADAVDATGA